MSEISNLRMDDNEMITSFSNPNYTLNNADALNSNNLPPHTTQYYEPDDDSSPSSTGQNINSSTNKARTSANFGFESERSCSDNINSYNVYEDVASPSESEGHFSMDSSATTPAEHTGGILAVEHTEEGDLDLESPYSETTSSSGFMGYYATVEKTSQRAPLLEKDTHEEVSQVTVKTPLLKSSDVQRLQIDSLDPNKHINSPGGDSNDSGIQADVQHVRGPVNEDLYAVVDKSKAPKPQVEEKKTEEEAIELPPGWEKHQDDNGPYYWHIKSGTIQREPPPPPSPSKARLAKPNTTAKTSNVTSTAETPSEKLLHQFEGHALKYATQSIKSLKSHKHDSACSREDYPIRFAVRSLGWVDIAEEDLTPERSSKAVNKCIVDLSLGRNDINDVVGRWGDGKDLYMDLDEENLTLTDPTDLSLLNVQPIHSIRVWGVGRDNGRDFAYVARDRVSKKHKCHVFRCDTPARQIANTLRDICKKIMLERSLREGVQAMSTTNKTIPSGVSRPNNLPNLEKLGEVNGQKITFQDLIKNTSFPTPMEEPKKVLRCHYLGEVEVAKPTGVDTINNAMEKVYSRVPPEKWHFASVAVAPSTITVSEHTKPDNILAECRVRFLSFMGIAQRNVRLCSFIMHTAQEKYIAHVFHCEPSAGALCKTIEAACKLRYQKCLDAHQKQMQNTNQTASQQQSKSQGVTSALNSLKVSMNNVLDLIKKKTNTASQQQ